MLSMGDTAPMDIETSPQPDPGRDLDRHLADVRNAPADGGSVALIVIRPERDEREAVAEAVLDPAIGVVGDNWVARGSRSMPGGVADPEAQVTIMSTRVLAAFEPDATRWPLAGDQIYVDADLSVDNLPAGTRIAIGGALLEISEKPHTGCVKFGARFGPDALRWINSPVGRELRMRGVNARVVRGGTVRVGDTLRRA
jgi:MOSC domain-containing protein YiiM